MKQRRRLELDSNARALRVLDTKNKVKTEFRLEDIEEAKVQNESALQLRLIFKSYTHHRSYHVAFDTSFDFVQFRSALQALRGGDDSVPDVSVNQIPFREQAAAILQEGGRLLCDR